MGSPGPRAIKLDGVSGNMISHAPERVYKSAWFAVTPGTGYTITHDLGTIDLITSIQFAPDNAGAPDLTKVFEVKSQHGAMNRGCQIQQITTSTLKIQTGYYGPCEEVTSAGNVAPGVHNTGWLRVLIHKLT